MAICNNTGYSVSQLVNLCTTGPVGIPGFFTTTLQCFTQAGAFANGQQQVGGDQQWNGIAPVVFNVPPSALNNKYAGCDIVSMTVTVFPLAGIQATVVVKVIINNCIEQGESPYSLCGGPGPHEINLVEVATFNLPACNPSNEQTS